MQQPYFEKMGLDLSLYHPGTLNLSIAPLHYEVVKPRLTFRQVKWHPVEPAEDFSFFDCQITTEEGSFIAVVYFPHPETKPEHFQAPDILEVLAPTIPNLTYGITVTLAIDPTQMIIQPTP